MTYRWNYSTLTTDQKNKKNELAKELNLHPVLAELLIKRGIETKEKAIAFLYPKLKELHDPFLLPDMDVAIRRIERALGNKERILIYGDYDVDGTTAVSLVYKFFRGITSNIDYYIPDRYDEGYGISFQGIDYAVETGVKLIISLDCGIKAVSKVAYAKEKGIDFIICDHHMPDDQLPDAVAVVDAKRLDSTYPYSDLSGCGVGFKLVHAFSQRNGYPFSDIEPLLDLVAVSIASDIVPLTGENRILMYHGLKQLNSNPSFGLRGIIEICGLQRKHITVNDIVFKIGPRINASGRMMNGKEAVDLMIENDMTSAREKSKNIDKYNEDRRELDKKITDEAIAYIDNHIDIIQQKSIVIYNETWHKGIVGIVASRLTEKYYRPAVVLTKSGEMISGSARSVPGFDVYKAIESCRDILENFGGHTYAAGLTLREENLQAFTERFNMLSFDGVEARMMLPQITVDVEISLSQITPALINGLDLFNPFGPENENPIFLTREVYDAGNSRLVGKESRHIKLEIVDKTTDRPFPGIAFSQHNFYQRIKAGLPVDICYTIEENRHGANSFTQLIIRDIKE
ncbi:single-stranded-DNA-specific exonuclease [Porphyromonadaceae bacterium NLAE-zl-C104]|uniref:single-stranded-DNA-specific exonuclease RecJ n=1 Tax=Proteiniphilum sp. TaxID=1926877 RepID=UPI00089A3396|nr:single-stranded-DNA-specific exonuclease RecJ [Proteiniphilum sp.]MDY9918051.1 single-stranded-DNA-specific exonuclease RecJ [Proteiniphilum sp.]SDZ94168.1 single-stranded-DNA-specific exonuclease [Porphyromonadaceae bacterium KH3R12]SFS87885.1 single-stranded-DNA-specific exonuclease [Porphyromonadaceae bacterium NLAE-zl-C104]